MRVDGVDAAGGFDVEKIGAEGEARHKWRSVGDPGAVIARMAGLQGRVAAQDGRNLESDVAFNRVKHHEIDAGVRIAVKLEQRRLIESLAPGRAEDERLVEWLPAEAEFWHDGVILVAVEFLEAKRGGEVERSKTGGVERGSEDRNAQLRISRGGGAVRFDEGTGPVADDVAGDNNESGSCSIDSRRNCAPRSSDTPPAGMVSSSELRRSRSATRRFE